DNVLPIFLFALFFCWMGDILLMKGDMKWLIAGGISFMVGHVFFMIGYSHDIVFSSEHLLPALLLAMLFVFAAVSIFLKMKPDLPKQMVKPMIGYLLINAAMNCFAIMRMISNPGIPAFITCIGAMLFFVSDSFWFYVRFKKEGRLKTHFGIMLTYALGELLIIIGLL
ncbi:MAG: lysoplasmalogenase, partial [Lachnospiraceae bacterium]|nr:lysoplasmalogenase [Lachnospiraceae bacterium]